MKNVSTSTKMHLLAAIDLNNLEKYSNVDASTIIFDYAKYNMFIDIFTDVNQLESNETEDTQLTVAENIIYVMYCDYGMCNLTINDKIRLLFKLMQRGFSKSIFDNSKTCAGYR